MNISKIGCFFLGHKFYDEGEERDLGTSMPFPCIGEVFQPQKCKRCKIWREVWSGFTWYKDEE